MAIDTIVVGTDGWSAAAAAVERAAVLARNANAKLVVVYGYNDPGGQDGVGIGRRVDGPSPIDVGRGVIESVARHYPDLTIDGQIREGQPADVITGAALDVDADIVVVGNRGMASLLQRFTSSIAHELAHRPPTDLLVVHTTDGRHPELIADADRGEPYAQVAAAYDGTDTAAIALQRAIDVCDAEGGELHVVYAGSGDAADDVRAKAEAIAGERGCAMAFHAADGSPAETVLSLAKQAGADLIVVGNKGMEERHLIRQVPEQIARGAECDLLIVRTTS